MKRQLKKVFGISMIVFITLIATSCGAEFNTIGITLGNLENGGEVTSQGGNTFYLKDGDIYKTDDVEKEGKRIIEGDMTSLNVVGEKLYFYDNEISTICKSNTEGKKVERIAEIYCGSFVVNRDNIYATILTGEGGDDIDDSDNYNIVRMKTTDKKLTNKMSNVIIKKGKLLGCIGDNIYVEKKNEGKSTIYRFDLEGKNEEKLLELSPDDKVVGNSEGIYLMTTRDDVYGIYRYDFDGKFDKKIINVNKKQNDWINAINIDDEFIYYEDYSQGSDGKVETIIVKLEIETGEKTTIKKFDSIIECSIAIGSDGIMYKAKPAGNIEVLPVWAGIH